MINMEVEVESKLVCSEIECFSIDVEEELRKFQYFNKVRNLDAASNSLKSGQREDFKFCQKGRMDIFYQFKQKLMNRLESEKGIKKELKRN